MFMERQSDIFQSSEADRWFQRNLSAMDSTDYRKTDPVLEAIDAVRLPFRRVLEVGCSNGWRLNHLREASEAECFGIEPSAQAVADAGRFAGISVRQGTARELPFDDKSFDLLVFGFCLYLCDRADLFRIACEADRVLNDGGVIAVYDFWSTKPYKNPYAHLPNLFSYKMDHARLFDWNPIYKTIYHRVRSHKGPELPENWDAAVAVTLLKKDAEAGFPLNA